MVHRNLLENAAECGCLPGTTENGYHEQRSEACKAIELEQWARACELAKEMNLKARVENMLKSLP